MIAGVGMVIVAAVGITITAVAVTTTDTVDAATITGVATAGRFTQMKAAQLAPLFCAREYRQD
jgi:hypothetical protein